VEIGIFILVLLVRIMVSAVSLWLAMKMTKESGPFLLLLAAASMAAAVELLPIPYIGSVVSYIVLLVLISKWTTAEIWPDAVLMTIVASFLASLASFALRAALR
jgi:hypothetical protein